MKLVSATGVAAPLYTDTSFTDRCAKCRQLELWTPDFSITESREELDESRGTCDFCRMRWEVCHHLTHEQLPVARFDRDQSVLRLHERYPPVLSIRRCPGEFGHHTRSIYMFSHVLTST